MGVQATGNSNTAAPLRGDVTKAGGNMATEKRRAEGVINRNADDIWKRIGNFGQISWIPGAEQEHVRMDGNIRTVGRAAWKFKLVQRLVECDDKRRTYSFDLPAPIDLQSLAGPGKVINTLNATLAVTPISETQSRVTWDVETEDFLINGTHTEYQAAIDAVKAELEA
jgi:hypothetical protein